MIVGVFCDVVVVVLLLLFYFEMIIQGELQKHCRRLEGWQSLATGWGWWYSIVSVLNATELCT